MKGLLPCLLVAAGLHATAAAAASVSVSAIAAPAGGTVSVTATGLPPSTPVSIALDGDDEASATTDATGALAPTPIEVPATAAPGRHTITVDDGGAAAGSATLATERSGAPEVLDETLQTKGAGLLHFAVSLPAGAATGTRYPVVYFLHGLPASDASYSSWPVELNEALGTEAQQAIVVAPQGARASDTDPEYLDWGAGRNWATALAVELPRYVDAHFPTIADRTGRAVIGVSAGGYGAVSLGLDHLGTFSVIESWSGYFEPTTPDGRRPLNLGSKRADARASMLTQIPTLNARFARDPTFLGFYVGRGDQLFFAANVAFHHRLVAAGVKHTWGLYAGGHRTSLWLAEAPFWFSLALGHLAAAA